eukprot:CAMPEP_0204917640 /NCGR_PEP_ID=MMETSP1397-20131031/15251_1 /ASSEMBLY_ACC=CAM_ASM_000891 /TAXON_ID=49980 /ORGANISM="Climacostomum Climacostomum virens, Strain Stock W-24" /LENGTH=76 /DNA_ID=CAMNT_0052090545 /DNA_START=1 /DNA_END=231 /DNA_ORIENTATION=-
MTPVCALPNQNTLLLPLLALQSVGQFGSVAAAYFTRAKVANPYTPNSICVMLIQAKTDARHLKHEEIEAQDYLKML